MIAAGLLNGICGAQVLPQGVRPGAAPRTPDEAAYRDLARQRIIDSRNQGEMRRTEQIARESARLPREKFGKLTAKEKKRIEAMRAPNPQDLVTYSAFLSQPGTGIVRLLPGYNCESKFVVRVDGNCANNLPGGSFHRFREDALSGDIVFLDGDLVAEGFFSNSIMTGLGNIPLDQVSSETRGMKFLTEFKPEADLALVKKQYLQVLKGVEVGEHVYANRLSAVPDMTYALRIIAYKNGNNVNKRLNRYQLLGIEPPPESQDLMFLALKQDTRVDLTVSFRVIRKDADGSITLIWKELSRKEPPEIVFPDEVALADFK
jgi:hypothetical protein